MKKSALIITVLIWLILAGCASVPSAELPVVTIANNTGYTIYYLYISPVTTDFWEEDVLGQGVLDNRETFKVRLTLPLSKADCYDVMLIDSNGNSYTRMDVPIKPDTTLVFTVLDLDK